MALIDSGASLGQVVAYTAMEMAVEKARGAGVAVVGGSGTVTTRAPSSNLENSFNNFS
jgi:LDH2 family malate/lactate/ureidoglycolate dehydrogenase